MKPSNISPALLEKYLNNQCTDSEKELVEAWYASLRGTTDYIGSLTEHKRQILQDETFLNIKDAIDASEETVQRKFPFSWLAGVAASITILLGIFFMYHQSSDKQNSISKQIAEKAPEDIFHFINNEPRIVRHQLPDSSVVWMHSEAAITYPKKFDRNKRLVTFTGEGFFDIKKDKSRPFSIQSGEMVVRVLGTSFNVNAQTTKKIFRISVVTGSVEVTAPDKEQKEQVVILKPRQEALFETQSGRLTSSAVPLQNKREIYESVTILFDNTPLNQVVSQLEKRFNIHISLSNPKISSCRVSADFEQQPLPLIMEMLCTALDATYTISGNTIMIDALPCPD